MGVLKLGTPKIKKRHISVILWSFGWNLAQMRKYNFIILRNFPSSPNFYVTLKKRVFRQPLLGSKVTIICLWPRILEYEYRSKKLKNPCRTKYRENSKRVWGLFCLWVLSECWDWKINGQSLAQSKPEIFRQPLIPAWESMDLYWFNNSNTKLTMFFHCSTIIESQF